MTIETGSAQGAARSAAASESRAAKNKQGDSANTGGGGFMAVLASVETAQTATPAASDPAVTRKSASAKSKAADCAQTDAKTVAGDVDAQTYTATVTDDVLAKPTADDTDPAAAAAAAALALLNVATDLKAGTDTPMDAAALLAQSAAWATGAKVGTEPAAGQDAFADANGVVGADGPRAKPVATPVAPVAPELSASQFTEGLQKAAKANGDAQTQSFPGATPSAEAPVVPDGKALAANQKGATDLHVAPALAAAVANVAAVVTTRRGDQPLERSVFRSGTEEAVAPQAISTAAPTLTVSSSPEVIAPTDAFVAEKVSYWISNNVQNAEMKLGGFGDRPVEVSIRMQGNEAHVAFRTDELQTRAALENASAHLKDMLQHEGLVLSGVSVGTAGTGDSGAQDRQSRQGTRQTTVTALQPIGGELRGVSNRAISGGLDLFV